MSAVEDDPLRTHEEVRAEAEREQLIDECTKALVSCHIRLLALLNYDTSKVAEVFEGHAKFVRTLAPRKVRGRGRKNAARDNQILAARKGVKRGKIETAVIGASGASTETPINTATRQGRRLTAADRELARFAKAVAERAPAAFSNAANSIELRLSQRTNKR